MWYSAGESGVAVGEGEEEGFVGLFVGMVEGEDRWVLVVVVRVRVGGECGCCCSCCSSCFGRGGGIEGVGRRWEREGRRIRWGSLVEEEDSLVEMALVDMVGLVFGGGIIWSRDVLSGV